MIKGDKKIIKGWLMFDWANSVYALVILSTIFPAYYTATAVHVDQDFLILFGMKLKNTFVLDVILSLSCLFVAFSNPILSGIADFTGKKLLFMKVFNWIGVLGCASLFFFDQQHIWIGLVGAFMASVGYNGSLVFYNAYLPEIAEEKDHDEISAKGFAYGYLGGAFFLIMILASNILIISNKSSFSFLPSVDADISNLIFRWSFLLLGIWWASFARITFSRLPSNVYNKKVTKDVFFHGINELKKVYHEIMLIPRIKTYLLSYSVFALAVQTMMMAAGFFAMKEVNFPEDQKAMYMIGTILVIQFVGIIGSFFFAFLSKRLGNIKALILGLTTYAIACLLAFFVEEPMPFYGLAALVGLGMGGIQSLSRSTFSKLLPVTEDHASYFSFYDFIEKISIVFGLLLYGGIEQITHSQRYSVVSLTLVFIVGIILLKPLLKEEKLKPINQ